MTLKKSKNKILQIFLETINIKTSKITISHLISKNQKIFHKELSVQMMINDIDKKMYFILLLFIMKIE